MIGVAVLGATGSIGRSTLDVIARHPDRYQVIALAARSSREKLEALCLQFRPRYAALEDPDAALELQRNLKAAGLATEVQSGQAAIAALACLDAVDVVMAAISGAAGLASTLAAAEAGKRLLLANKESVVMAGALLMRSVQRSGATLIPIDSEHNAIFQCLPGGSAPGRTPRGVRRLLLTASGGPFLEWPAGALARATPEQACAHPRWSMGRKISVDSATLMNKGLELIEASVLFAMPAEAVDVVVHPQSIVHSLVEYLDGSVLAQLGSPDMRTPIAQALAWPERMASGVEFLDLVAVGRLDFRAPDRERFPCLALAEQAARAGGLASTWLNAADEVAVQAFLAHGLNFGDIAAVIDTVMNKITSAWTAGAAAGLEDVRAADVEARVRASEAVQRRLGGAPRSVHA